VASTFIIWGQAETTWGTGASRAFQYRWERKRRLPTRDSPVVISPSLSTLKNTDPRRLSLTHGDWRNTKCVLDHGSRSLPVVRAGPKKRWRGFVPQPLQKQVEGGDYLALMGGTSSLI
jgi:hypothetical protein